MGRLLACELAGQGHQVSIFDAATSDGQGAAARVAAAMLAPLAESAITEPPVVKMGQHSLQRWPELLLKLERTVFFQRHGTLIVWHRQDAGEAARFKRELARTQSQIPSLPQAQTLDSAQLAKLEPALSNRFASGLFLPGEGQLDNRQLLQALLHQMQVLGVTMHWNSARQLKDFSAAQSQNGGWLFDCRGLGARPGWHALRGVRGEVIRLHAPEVSLERPVRLIHPRYPLYIAPKPDHVFVVGATEIESDDMSPASVRSTLELLSAAYTVHSGFAESRILEIATQIRPALPDNLPSIRRLGPRTLQINGLYRHGFLVAPALLDVVMQCVLTGDSALAGSFSLTIQDAAPTRSC